MDFEVVNFVATTRRWYDRGNPRDAGDATPAKVQTLRPPSGGLSYTQNFIFLLEKAQCEDTVLFSCHMPILEVVYDLSVQPQK